MFASLEPFCKPTEPSETANNMPEMDTRPAAWDPRVVLGLVADDQTQWCCVGTVSSNPDEPRRCSQPISSAGIDTAKGLLVDMSHQLPDLIDHSLLLQLAEACLCTEGSDPHRGAQEATVIYGWTEMLAAEACVLRQRNPLPSPPPEPSARKARRPRTLSSHRRLVTDLMIQVGINPTEKSGNSADTASSLPESHRFPTPTAMTFQEAWKQDHHDSDGGSDEEVTRPVHIPQRHTNPALSVKLPPPAAAAPSYQFPLTPPDSATASHAPNSASSTIEMQLPAYISQWQPITTTTLGLPSPNPLLSAPITSPLFSAQAHAQAQAQIQQVQELNKQLNLLLSENQTLLRRTTSLRDEVASLQQEDGREQREGHTYREGEGNVGSRKLHGQQAEIEAVLVMLVQVVRVVQGVVKAVEMLFGYFLLLLGGAVFSPSTVDISSNDSRDGKATIPDAARDIALGERETIAKFGGDDVALRDAHDKPLNGIRDVESALEASHKHDNHVPTRTEEIASGHTRRA